jgi:long-chain acyl-CoA synthetase
MNAHVPARPWLAHYPKAVAAEIDPAAIGTIADLIDTACLRFPTRPAFESFGKSVTYAQMLRSARAFAAQLQARGLKKGDRVALMMPNILAYPAAMFGTLIGGFTVVNVNPLYTARELTHQVNDSGAKALVVIENFAHVVQEALPHLKLDLIYIATAGDLMGVKGHIVNFVARKIKKVVKPYAIPGALPLSAALSGNADPAPVTITPDDIAFLQYTGGTTGVAKGATLSHRNIAANVAQAAEWLGWALERPDAKPDYQHVMVTALPLYHIFALTCCCLFMLRIGAKGLLIANPRDIDGFVKTLKTSRFTLMSGVNTLYNALANHPDIATVDYGELCFSVSGGMATQAAVAGRWKAITGKPIIEGYGLSETSPIATCNPPDIESFSGTIGYPVPSTDVAVRTLDNADVAEGEAGEICIRGPQVMVGYWNRPDETAQAMTPDGYFRTGDIGVRLPDGQFKIVDRIKDMVLVSGFNVYPSEVEDVLASCPGVLEVAVVGVPDQHSGEAVAAYIVKRAGAEISVESVRNHCKESLTAYKIPKHVVFRESLPKTNVGKVLRRALRDEAVS